MPESIHLVSVIVPVYNAEKYLCNCLDSILASNLPLIEIICVDDGSTDASSEILRKYSQQEKIIVIHQTNSGPSKARNTGLKVAKGEYVGFVDADDWIEPAMYKTMYEAAKANHAELVQCGIWRNEDIKTTSALPTGIYDQAGIAKNIFPKLICASAYHGGHQTLRGSVWCRLFQRQHLLDHHIHFCEEINNNEDMLFCLQAVLAAKCYVCLADDYLYHNRSPQGTLTRKYQPQMWERQQVLIQELRDKTQSSPFDFSRQIDYKIFQIAQYSIFFDQAAGSPLTKQEQFSRVKLIAQSEIFQETIRKISPKILRPIELALFFAFRLRLYRLAHWLVVYRSSKRK